MSRISEFQPAFDMPATAKQALAVIQAWGDPSCMTFSVSRCKAAWKLLSDAMENPPHDTTVSAILAEEQRSVRKFPTWPSDPLHAMGVVHEEVGELAKEVLQLVYEPHKTTGAAVAAEAMQAAAMLIRFARSLERYDFEPGPQHRQVSHD